MIHKVLTVVWYALFFYILPWMFIFGSYDYILTKSGTKTQRMAMETLHLNPPPLANKTIYIYVIFSQM